MQASTYYEYENPTNGCRSQWIVEPTIDRWAVRYGAENSHGRWSHFPSVPFDTQSEAIEFVERMMGRHSAQGVIS
jgi:hypothetical protein